MMKVLFLTLYPESSPSSRFRVYQFVPFLESEGICCAIKPVLNNELFLKTYNKRGKLAKMAFHSLELINRVKDIIFSANYDLVLVQKGLVSINLVGLDKLLLYCNKRIIFDFDDAVFGLTQFLPSFMHFLQDQNQVEKIVRFSKTVIAGNYFLAEFAGKFNSSVNILPTSIDTDRYIPGNHKMQNYKTVIGWTGSSSTNFYVNKLIPVLNRLIKKYPIKFKIISKGLDNIRLEQLDKSIELEYIEWKYESEIKDLNDIDIGTMPLNDDLWSRGKCGLKALQFMSLDIPVVCSPVGVNEEIVQEGNNGFLASSEDEWFNKLSMLIEDAKLRDKVGKAGRRKVEENYSLKVNAPKFKKILEESLEK